MCVCVYICMCLFVTVWVCDSEFAIPVRKRDACCDYNKLQKVLFFHVILTLKWLQPVPKIYKETPEVLIAVRLPSA